MKQTFLLCIYQKETELRKVKENFDDDRIKGLGIIEKKPYKWIRPYEWFS